MALLLLVACGKGATSQPTVSDEACVKARGDLRVLQSWKAPAGCKLPHGNAPLTYVASDEELGCASGIDFTKYTLVLSGQSASPAWSGTEALDDGKTVTFLSKFRSPCEGDPMPMPMPITIAFLIPAGETREVGQASCTLDTKCP
jgi:hypothetical protein